MHKESDNYVNHADDGCPHPHVTRQIGRDGKPPVEQQVCRPNEERKTEERESDVAGGSGKPRDKQAVLRPVRV